MSLSSISMLWCQKCGEETRHMAGVCNHCGARFVTPPARKAPMHELMTFNYQQFEGSRPIKARKRKQVTAGGK